MRVANQSTVEIQRNQMVKSLFCDVVKRWLQCGHDPDRSWGGGGGGGTTMPGGAACPGWPWGAGYIVPCMVRGNLLWTVGEDRHKQS